MLYSHAQVLSYEDAAGPPGSGFAGGCFDSELG
jgi:hypothetical protein